ADMRTHAGARNGKRSACFPSLVKSAEIRLERATERG
ncbi:MAG: hypothetical protein ACJAXT_001232, partial [Paracoccaceae bacterium]